MEYSIDNMEAGQAVLISREGEALAVPVGQLPPGAAEGDVLLWEQGAFIPSPGLTEQRRAEAGSLLARILHKNGPPDEPEEAVVPPEDAAEQQPEAITQPAETSGQTAENTVEQQAEAAEQPEENEKGV